MTAPRRLSRALTPGLTTGVVVSVATLIWLAYTGVQGWRTSAATLAERRASESAQLLVRALTRDMRGAQASVLSSPRWDQFMLDPPYDVGTVVAGAFARYPYPESFFAWRAEEPPVFFNRFDRRPPWIAARATDIPFPVTIADDPPGARAIATRVRADAAQRRTFSVFEIPLAGALYQVVARLLYRDPLRDHLEAVFGFTVNLPWVRQHYFSEVTRQVARISGTDESFTLAVLDASGTHVVGAGGERRGDSVLTEQFSMAFFDPASVDIDPPADLSREQWRVEVNYSGDPALLQAMQGANRTLLVATVAALSLGIGLMLTLRATRVNARLVEMRSEFVSTVTHELKTPIATLRAIGDTVAAGRITHPNALNDYAALIVQESKRLARLVDNLLAFARITDVTEVYVFEEVDLEPLVDDVLKTFDSQLTSGSFNVCRDIPGHVPPVKGDKTALELMLDNLVDNAIRYSRIDKQLTVSLRSHEGRVLLVVRDRGMGIPAEEIPQVTRKFFRGRRAGSGGSGLGLAIAARIVADHRGTLSIESQPNAGTSVTVSFAAGNAT